jgi:GxxExxY protein
MLYAELTKRIIAVAMSVIRELGAGFIESVYHNAMMVALNEAGLQAVKDPRVTVVFHEQPVGWFKPDIIVEGKVMVELKAASSIAPEHQAIAINYLKATGIEVGLILNFGRPKLEVRRLHR